MQTSPVRLIEYFDGTKQSVIPLFQRRYSWTKKNWKGLWDDILELMDGGPTHSHFMGAIVSVPAQTVPVGVNKHLVIDGQQRLTTISILLAALRTTLDEKTAARITDYLTNRHFDGPDRLKLFPTQGDRLAYLSIIDGKAAEASDHLMGAAYNFFIKSLKSEHPDTGEAIDPELILSTIESSLRVVMINLDETDDPYIIFESLNYRGEPLTHADLVRNFILMKFKNAIGDGGEQERVYSDYWKPVEEALRDKLTTYLMHYCRKDGAEVRKNTIYSSFKERVERLRAPDELEAELSSLRRHAAYYARFLDPKRDPSGDPVTKYLSAFEDLEVSTCFPLLLKLFFAVETGLDDEESLQRTLAVLESYLVRRSICGLPNNAIDQLFIQVAGTLDCQHMLDSVTVKLASATGRMRWPLDGEFRQAVLTQPQYSKKSTPYVLRRLEQLSGHKESPDLGLTSIEHIMPQTLTNEWEVELGGIPAADIHARYLHTFGNLTLTGYNPELKNYPFARKRDIYAASNIDMNKWIAQQARWAEAQLQTRSTMMAEECIKLWPRPAN